MQTELDSTRGVISGGMGGGKRADPGVELGWSPRQAV